MASDVDIANRALSRLGAARVTALADDTKNGRAVNSAFELVREEVLTDHPWNVATKRAKLYAPSFTVTAAAWVSLSSRYRVTIGNHRLRVGDLVSISGVEGDLGPDLNDEFIVGAKGGTTIDLKDPDTGEFVDGSAFAAWTAGGEVLLLGAWQHRFQYDLPEDCLRLLEIDGQRESAWLIETGRVLTDLGAPLDVRYIWLNTDTESYPPLLVSALAARLAAELALEIVDSPDKRDLAMADYQGLLSRAKGADGREQTPAELEESTWITVRLTA